ncbi:MAG: ABC-F family ATP-binding cassette domain-containing protein [Chlamydiota bacterium]
MTLLFNCQSISKSFGSKPLFQDLSFSLFSSDQLGLIGPNGSGKSTLLNILTGKEKPDSGTLSFKKGLKIGYVPQACEFPPLPIKEILIATLEDFDIPDYEKEVLAETWMSKMGFTESEPTANLLSGGWKKRLSIAKELILSPDLLLLDEPTNHLDLEGILFLENFLKKANLTFLIVSHDRYFLQNTTNRIFELNPTYPEGMFSIDGTYDNFLEKKEEFLQGQLHQERSIASKARRETHWLRQNAKARTTKSQARIDEAHELLEEFSDIKKRNRQKTTSLDFSATERVTRKLIVAKNLSKKLGEKTLFQHLDFTLSPGTRLGLIGPNGSGKTTLLKLLASEIDPDLGSIKTAEGLQTVYFDQHRIQLPLTLSLRKALVPYGDHVNFRGREIHINGWCKRFLFSPDLLDLPISKLSGGERARIAIAHLMLQPADVLLLDEPTNDLDIPTLETLEESLLDFPGAVVLITHDRCMLHRICNLFLPLGNLEDTQLYPDYSQWESSMITKDAKPKVKEKKDTDISTLPATKLSYKEKKEYEQVEEKIAKLEAEVKALNHLLENDEITKDSKKLQEICSAVGIFETQIEQLYIRYEMLDQKKKQSGD